MTSFSFWVSGIPQTKGSTRVVGRRGARARIVGDNQNTKAWQRDIGFALRKAGWRADPDAVNGFELIVNFYLPRPLDHFDARGELKAWAPLLPGSKPDGDKLLRAVFDALTGIVYQDDAQVVSWPGGKRYALRGQPPGAEITIRKLIGGAKGRKR